MKSLLYFLFILLFISCKDDINDSKYRNSNYVFYKKDGESGVWQIIIKNSNNKHKLGTLTYFFDNGDIFATTKILDSFPNRIVDFYDKRKIASTYFYENNILTKTEKKDGFQTEYLSNKGIIIGKGNIKNNKEHGEWEEYDDDGNLERIAIYKNGLRHGDFKEFYTDGKLKTIGKMWNGMRQDTISWFYKSGNLKCIEVTKIDTINKTSKATSYQYYNSGKLHKEIQIINEKKNGTCEIFYENGKLESISQYVDDLMHGEGLGYYKSGIISYKGKVIKNNVHGDFKYYNENGKLYKIEKYYHGQFLDSIVY